MAKKYDNPRIKSCKEVKKLCLNAVLRIKRKQTKKRPPLAHIVVHSVDVVPCNRCYINLLVIEIKTSSITSLGEVPVTVRLTSNFSGLVSVKFTKLWRLVWLKQPFKQEVSCDYSDTIDI